MKQILFQPPTRHSHYPPALHPALFPCSALFIPPTQIPPSPFRPSPPRPVHPVPLFGTLSPTRLFFFSTLVNAPFLTARLVSQILLFNVSLKSVAPPSQRLSNSFPIPSVKFFLVHRIPSHPFLSITSRHFSIIPYRQS